MFATFVVMAAIELSLLIDKPNARYFAFTIVLLGLLLRALVLERRMKREPTPVEPRTVPTRRKRKTWAISSPSAWLLTSARIFVRINRVARAMRMALASKAARRPR